MTPDDANIARESTASAARAGASVVIATYNGAKRVPEVLAALAAQTAPDGSFEVIVVDNNSTDATAAAVESDPATAALRARGVEVRVVSEPRQGVLFARLKGVREASAELVTFVDDDNLPDPDYLSFGMRQFDDSTLAMINSKVEAAWETSPPPSVLRRRHLFAVNDYLGDSPRDFGANGSFAPTVTAGMWVRREVFLAAVPWREPKNLLSGRVGKYLISGEDIEFGILVGMAGYRRIYNPDLRVKHRIPESRLQTAYVRRLIEGIVRSELTLKERYFRERVGLRIRLIALAQLGASPFIALYRGDVMRETAFIASAAIARLKGPFRRAK